MPTRKIIFWLLAAAALYMISWNIGSGWLYTLTALLLAFPLVSFFLGRINTRRLDVTMTPADSARAGDSLKIRVALSNGSWLPRFFISLDCEFAGTEASLFFPYIGGRKNASDTLIFNDLKRGIYTGADVVIRSGAPIGLVRSRRRAFCHNPLAVYPAWSPLGSDWTSGHWATGHMASSSLPSRRASSDYLGVRDYRSDDSPRSIHWRSTARHGQLSVVEYSRLSVVQPVFLVDTFEGDKSRSAMPEEVFESMVSLTASLVQREAANSRRFALGSDAGSAADFKLGHGSDAAMLWLAGVTADSPAPMDLSRGLPWPDATPVLILANHREYAGLPGSSLLNAHAHAAVIMFDVRPAHEEESGLTTASWRTNGFMDKAELGELAVALDAIGSRLLVIEDPDEGARCLRYL